MRAHTTRHKESMTNLGSCGLLCLFETVLSRSTKEMVGTSNCMTSILNLSLSLAQAYSWMYKTLDVPLMGLPCVREDTDAIIKKG